MNRRPAHTIALLALALASLPAHANTLADNGLTKEREAQLVRMVRQDCGSCHGMHLTGGLGPALTQAALGARATVPYLSAVITHGIQGTPMPPWKAMLSTREADWIATQLLAGFPEEPKE